MDRAQSQNLQDMLERGMWGDIEYVDGAGAVMSVRGTGTLDVEVPILNFGYGFALASGSNAEVVMLSLGNDVNDKVALPTLPRNVQYTWAEGTGGIQSPLTPDRRIEINTDETHFHDTTFVVGDGREMTITVDGTNVAIQTTGTVTVTTTGDLTMNAPNVIINAAVQINGASVTHNGTNIGDSHRHLDTPGLGANLTGGPQ